MRKPVGAHVSPPSVDLKTVTLLALLILAGLAALIAPAAATVRDDLAEPSAAIFLPVILK